MQWTPGAGQPGPGDEKWYGLYERILTAGKSAQILGMNVDQAKCILDTFGVKGVYISVRVGSEEEADEMIALVESMRG